jgi:hypothetical protein
MTKIRVRDTPRSSDDQVLDMLAMRQAGWSWPQIAKAHGSDKYQATQKLCANVLQDDLKYSGEPEARVRAGYR